MAKFGWSFTSESDTAEGRAEGINHRPIHRNSKCESLLRHLLTDTAKEKVYCLFIYAQYIINMLACTILLDLCKDSGYS